MIIKMHHLAISMRITGVYMAQNIMHCEKVGDDS